MTSGAMLGGHTKAIFGDVFEAVGLETERRLAVKVTEPAGPAQPSPMPYGPCSLMLDWQLTLHFLFEIVRCFDMDFKCFEF